MPLHQRRDQIDAVIHTRAREVTTEAGHKRLDAGVPSKGRVLIVDDDRDFAAALRNLLALEGYEVALQR